MLGYFQHESCKTLERNDFSRFSREFQCLLEQAIPTAEEISFVEVETMPPAAPTSESLREEYQMQELMNE